MDFMVAVVYILLTSKVHRKCQLFEWTLLTLFIPRCSCATKKPDVDVNTKQRTVVEFLTGENVDPKEIHRRLENFYGNETVDYDTVKLWAKRPGESDFQLNGQLLQRIVIQFLTSEGVVSSMIGRRLMKVYRSIIYSQCNICRWMRRYKEGDSYVRDRFRHGRPPHNRI